MTSGEGTNSLQVTWDPPLMYNGPSLSYTLNVSYTNNATGNYVLVASASHIENDRAPYFAFIFDNGLEPSTLYTAFVIAMNSGGQSAPATVSLLTSDSTRVPTQTPATKDSVSDSTPSNNAQFTSATGGAIGATIVVILIIIIADVVVVMILIVKRRQRNFISLRAKQDTSNR